MFKTTILNEKFCKPVELTSEQKAQIKKVQFEEKEKSKIGFGDFIAKIAQPVARTIDSVVGTNIQNCGGCKKRQEALNNLIPNIKNP